MRPGVDPGGAAAAVTRAQWLCMGAVAGIAVVLRLLAFDLDAVHHPDEVYQYLEAAHRLVFHRGVTPWEYRYGIRSWLEAVALSLPMRLGAWIAPASAAYLLAPKLACGLLALTSVGAAYVIGARLSWRHGLAAMWAMAVWFEVVYFSVHILTEVMATSVFLVGAASAERGPPSVRGAAFAGLMLGMAGVLRFQYGPAIATFELLTYGRGGWRTRLALLAGGCAALSISAAVDLSMNQTPFRWVLENVRQNVVAARAATYGVSGPFAFCAMLAGQWRFAAVPLLLLASQGAVRYPALFWTGAVNLGVHMAIGHKEYRFILLTTDLLVLLAALGGVEVLDRWTRPQAGRRGRRAGLAALMLAWAVLSASLAGLSPMRQEWRAMTPELSLVRAIGRRPDVCGLALHDLPFWAMGGDSYFHNPAPVYLTYWSAADRMSPQALSAAAPAFNAVMARSAASRELPAAFRRPECRGRSAAGEAGQFCLFPRAGRCRQTPSSPYWALPAVLLRHDA